MVSYKHNQHAECHKIIFTLVFQNLVPFILCLTNRNSNISLSFLIFNYFWDFHLLKSFNQCSLVNRNSVILSEIGSKTTVSTKMASKVAQQHLLTVDSATGVQSKAEFSLLLDSGQSSTVFHPSCKGYKVLQVTYGCKSTWNYTYTNIYMGTHIHTHTHISSRVYDFNQIN